MTGWVFNSQSGFSSTKFAATLSGLLFAFTVIAVVFSNPESALRDHWILGETYGAIIGVISGTWMKRVADKKASNNK